MRKVIIALVLLGSFSAVQAQGRQGIKKMKAQRQMLSDLAPEERATLKTKKMTLALDLTAKQQRGVQALNEEEARWKQEMMETRKESRESSETRSSAEERYKRQNQVLDQQIAYQQQLRELLDEDQYLRWKKIRARSVAGKRHCRDGRGDAGWEGKEILGLRRRCF